MTLAAAHSPADYLQPQTLSQIEGIDLRARHIVEGVMTGMHRSPYYGYSVEFAQHRPYTAGDDIKHLDWKVYGRTDKLYLKQYQQETNMDLLLLVDASGSMSYGSDPGSGRRWRKFDHATALAAAISYLALHQQDRAGLVVFADRMLDFVKPGSARGQWRSIVTALGGQPVDKPTSFARVFDEVIAKVHHRTLLVILSDFFEDAATLGAGLAQLHHRRHDVLLLQTMDRQELSFVFNGPQRLLGLENEGKLDIDPRALRQAYLREVSDHLEAIRREARRFQYDHELLDTHQDLGPPLAQFLARRAARLKKA